MYVAERKMPLFEGPLLKPVPFSQECGPQC